MSPVLVVIVVLVVVVVLVVGTMYELDNGRGLPRRYSIDVTAKRACSMKFG